MEDQRLAVHRTIVVVDVEGFGDQRRTNRDQVVVRDGLYRAMQEAFGRAGIPWEKCGHEDRGDGVFVLVPAEVPKGLLAESLPSALVTALRTHNDAHPGAGGIRLRMVLHAGEVQYDEHGVTSVAVNLAFRLLDASVLKAALASSPGVLAVIASSWFFEEVVRHSGTAAVYRPVEVAVKETTTKGWICLPDQMDPAGQAMLEYLPAEAAVPGGQPRPSQPVRLMPRPPGGSPDGAGQVVAGEIPARPAAFLERQAVAQLAGAWDAGMRVAVVQAVTGGRGVGKTQAAAAYARDRAAAGWPLVAWVTAETRDQLLTGLATVAVAVDVVDADGDSVVSARNVRRYLEKCPGPALVVFDNATDVDGLAVFLPTVGAAQVVITSTDRAFTRLGMTVDIGLFTPEQSVAYLTERTGLADADTAAAVAAELGYLPLALAQAATVISQQGLDYATYQRRLHQAPAAKYLTRHPGDPYPRGAVEAITLAIRSVEDQDDSGLARVIMGLLSVLSAEGVGRSILAGLAGAPISALAIGSVPPSDEAVDQALGRLAGGSILIRSETGQAFSMHRLVSRVVRERDEADGRLPLTLRVAVDLLQGLQIPREEGWLRREAGSQLVEQVSAVWAASSGRAAADDPQFREVTEQVISLRNWSVGQLTVAADLSRAIGLGIIVLADCERLLGRDHPDTLASRHNLAGAYESAGWPREAIALHERNLADRERLLGPDHPDTMASRHKLAEAYMWAGRRHKAIDLCERNLADRERLLGPDHPDTLASRNNLAGACTLAGQLRRAFSLRRLNVAEARRALEVGHPYRRRYQRRFRWYLPLPVILAMLALCAVWSMWTGNYYGAIFVLLFLALVVLAALAFRMFQRLLVARDWRFLSSPWYEQLRARFNHMGPWDTRQ